MKKNTAILDRFLRLVAAVILIVYSFKTTLATPWNYVLLLIAVVLLLTALTGFCPFYRLLGIDTRQFKESDFAAKK